MSNPTLPTSPASAERDMDDLDEFYVYAIQDAINVGMQLSCHHERERETCVTRFIDPWTSEVRFALEIWDARSKQMYDYATKAAAIGRQTREDNRLGI